MRLEQLSFTTASRDCFVTRESTGGKLALEMDELPLWLARVEQRVGVDPTRCIVVGGRHDRRKELVHQKMNGYENVPPFTVF